jgi:hypothetical protein
VQQDLLSSSCYLYLVYRVVSVTAVERPEHTFVAWCGDGQRTGKFPDQKSGGGLPARRLRTLRKRKAMCLPCPPYHRRVQSVLARPRHVVRATHAPKLRHRRRRRRWTARSARRREGRMERRSAERSPAGPALLPVVVRRSWGARAVLLEGFVVASTIHLPPTNIPTDGSRPFPPIIRGAVLPMCAVSTGGWRREGGAAAVEHTPTTWASSERSITYPTYPPRLLVELDWLPDSRRCM